MIPLQDAPAAGEKESVQAIVDATMARQRKRYQPGTTARRSDHPKGHGTVTGRFRVLDDLPAQCKVGLFSEPAVYETTLRFSNGARGPGSFDIRPNVRGVALKLHGVPGKKALLGHEDSTDHDFLLANHPTFFVPKIEEMASFAQRKILRLIFHCPSIFLNLIVAITKLVRNPLHLEYFSQVPYRFGTVACKYALRPAQHASFLPPPNGFDRDYLRHAIERELRAGDATFTFGAQFQQPGESIADSTVAWQGGFTPLAELVIPRTDQPIVEAGGESLSFNPWRVLPEHQPLGWPGRVREAVYVADYNWRTQTNKALKS